MGRDLFFATDSLEKVEQSKVTDPSRVAKILQLTQELSPSDLKGLFENMFKIMTTSSKEAVNELIWTGLTSQEQQSFEMPYYGHRWSATSIETAFEGAFSKVEELPSRELVIRTYRRPVNLDAGLQFGGSTTGTARLEPWASQPRQASPLEDQFFNILRDAIIRAERRPVTNLPSNRRSTSGNSPNRSTMNDQGTNTSNTESEP